jgi:hypothetical protein
MWVGTETRDYDDPKRGGIPQYRAYFIMRWLGGIGGEKCGGGWYDPFGTTEHTYLEQARQTVLGGARESFLFCYGALKERIEPPNVEVTGPGSAPSKPITQYTGARNIEVLRENVKELLAVSEQVRRRETIGVAAYNPPNSHPDKELYVYDFLGMMGLPLVPCHEFPMDAPAAFFSLHALGGRDFANKLLDFVGSGRPVLLTDGLAKELTGKTEPNVPNMSILKVKNNPKQLLEMTRTELNAIREPLLAPLKVTFRAPNKVALYLFRDGSWVVENFNDTIAEVRLNRVPLKIPARGWTYKFLGK